MISMRSDLVVSSDRNDHPQQDSSFAFVQNRTSKIDIDYPETIYGDFNPYEDIHITEEKEDQFFEVSGAGSERTNHRLVQKVLITTFVIILVGFGTAMYLIANLGAGPRDGLMTGLQKKTNAPIALVRTSIEIIVVLLGWSLGGIVGIGTLFYALGIGPIIALWLYFFSCSSKCLKN